MKKVIIGIILTLVTIVLLGIAVVLGVQSSQNRAIQMEQLVERAQSNLDAEYNRRAGLLVNLAEAVRSYDKHEADLLVELSKARTPSEGNGDVNASVYLRGVVERYPQLRSIENYDRYMTELAVTENRIAAHRNEYNTMVGQYRTHVRSFPTRMFLSFLGYQEHEYKFLEFAKAPVDAPTGLLMPDSQKKD